MNILERSKIITSDIENLTLLIKESKNSKIYQQFIDEIEPSFDKLNSLTKIF